jgi:hypothetical protein
MNKTSCLFGNGRLKTLGIPLIIERLLAVFVGMADSIMIAKSKERSAGIVRLGGGFLKLRISKKEEQLWFIRSLSN